MDDSGAGRRCPHRVEFAEVAPSSNGWVSEYSLMYHVRVATRATALPPEERRAAIVAAALPLWLERGANVSTRQIAEAAGIAEGTIFGAFPDKDAVVQAVLQAAMDPEPTERELASIDRSLSFEDQLIEAVRIIQRRTNNIWRLISTIGEPNAPRTPPTDLVGLAEIFKTQRKQLRTDPLTSARQLRALTVAVSNPMLLAGTPLAPREIVTLLLDGIRIREERGGAG
jgi:AcrR family transcriptional regulator